MITLLKTVILAFITSIIFIFSIIGYFFLGFLMKVLINDENSLVDYFTTKYIKYLIKKYPNIYYEDGGRYWKRHNKYQSYGIYEDKKVSNFNDKMSFIFFILWPIDVLYIFISKFKSNKLNNN